MRVSAEERRVLERRESCTVIEECRSGFADAFVACRVNVEPVYLVERSDSIVFDFSFFLSAARAA